MTKEEIYSKYDGMDNYKRNKSVYINKLFNLSMEQLKKETEDKIFLSAYASNNIRSDYHWHVDACSDVLFSRTNSDTLYIECYKNVVKEFNM